MGSKQTLVRDLLQLLAWSQVAWWESFSKIIKSSLLAIKSRSPCIFMSWNHKCLPSSTNKQVSTAPPPPRSIVSTDSDTDSQTQSGGVHIAAVEAKDVAMWERLWYPWEKKLLAVFEEWCWQHQAGKFSADACEPGEITSVSLLSVLSES